MIRVDPIKDLDQIERNFWAKSVPDKKHVDKKDTQFVAVNLKEGYTSTCKERDAYMAEALCLSLLQSKPDTILFPDNNMLKKNHECIIPKNGNDIKQNKIQQKMKI